jgi:hypothetical protein
MEPTLKRIAVTVGTAALVLTGAETFSRLDSTPKALPFHDVRSGTLVDHLFLKGASYDWLLIGSSRCVVNVDPNIFQQTVRETPRRDWTFFNAGLHGLNVSQTLRFFDLFFRPSVRRGVLLVLSPAEVGAGRNEIPQSYGLDYYSGRRNPVDRILMASHLFRYRMQYRDPRYAYDVVRHLRFSADLARRLGTNGFVPSQGDLIEFQRRLFATERSAHTARSVAPLLPAETADALRTMAFSLERSGRRFVVIIAPDLGVVSNRDDQTTMERSRGFYRWLTQTLASTGAAVIPFDGSTALEPRHFFDEAHLDQDGVRIFSGESARAFTRTIDLRLW